MTMLVWTCAGSMTPGNRRGTDSENVRARLWSSARPAPVGTLRRLRTAPDRRAGRGEHSVLRRDGAAHPLVDIQRLPDDFVHAPLYCARRSWHCHGARAARGATPSRHLEESGHRRTGRRTGNFHLLRARVSRDGWFGESEIKKLARM